MSHIVIGTAGHIDHGKTALVKALTGMDTDTLREERERQITIDLGVAFLGDGVTVIDVPGHERFIKNMITGVATLDHVLLVVAADDGIMPQTREHTDILQLLGIRSGTLVVTKTSMVDSDWLELVCEELREFVRGTFLEHAPLHRVDSLSGADIEELRSGLQAQLAELPLVQESGIFRLAVDRAFSVKGHGTVVTGTVLSGRLKTGDELELLPSLRRTKARGLQTHGQPVACVSQNDRAAINLQAVALEEVQRGDILATPGIMKPGTLLDVSLTLLPGSPPLANRDRVRVHIGTSEILARVVLLGLEVLSPGMRAVAQLRLEEPVAALKDDRFVIRRYSPMQTIGGGQVLDPRPLRHRPHATRVQETLAGLNSSGTVAEELPALMQVSHQPLWKLGDVQSRFGGTVQELEPALRSLVDTGVLVELKSAGEAGWALPATLAALSERLVQQVRLYHERFPEQALMPLAELRSRSGVASENALFDHLLTQQASSRLRIEGAGVAERTHEVTIPAKLRTSMDALLARFQPGTLPPPRPVELAQELQLPASDVRRLLNLLQNEHSLLAISPEVQLTPACLDQTVARLRAFASDLPGGLFSVSQAGQCLDAPRRFTVPLLEYLDKTRLTERVDNDRRFLA